MMKFCPYCGAEMPAITHKCPTCGKQSTRRGTATEVDRVWDDIKPGLIEDHAGQGVEKERITTTPLSFVSQDEIERDGERIVITTPPLGSKLGLEREELWPDLDPPDSPSNVGSHDIEHDTSPDGYNVMATEPEAVFRPTMPFDSTSDASRPRPDWNPEPTTPGDTPTSRIEPSPERAEQEEGGGFGGVIVFGMFVVVLMLLIGAGSLGYFYFTSPVEDAPKRVEKPEEKERPKKEPKKKVQKPEKTKKPTAKKNKKPKKPAVKKDEETKKPTVKTGLKARNVETLIAVKDFRAEAFEGFIHGTDLLEGPAKGSWAVVQLGGVDALVIPRTESNNPPRQARLIATELLKAAEAHHGNDGGKVEVFPLGPAIQLVWQGGGKVIQLMSIEEAELKALARFDEDAPGDLTRGRHLARWLTALLDAIVLGREPATVRDKTLRKAFRALVKVEKKRATAAEQLEDQRISALNRHAYVTLDAL